MTDQSMNYELNDRQRALSESLVAQYPVEMRQTIASAQLYCTQVHDSVSEEHAILVTTLSVPIDHAQNQVDQSLYYLTNTLPTLSCQTFLAICSDCNPDSVAELLAHLDARSEVDDSLKTGYFGEVTQPDLNDCGWYGFFLVPVGKWIQSFPKTLNTTTDSYHCSLLVLLTESELKLANQQGNRALYQHLRDQRKVVYYANMIEAQGMGRRLQTQKQFDDLTYARRQTDPINVPPQQAVKKSFLLKSNNKFRHENTSVLDEHQLNLKLHPTSNQLPNLPTSTGIQTQFFMPDRDTLRNTLDATPHSEHARNPWGNERTSPADIDEIVRKQTNAINNTKNKLSNWKFHDQTARATAYERLVGDLKFKLHANIHTPQILDQLPNHGIQDGKRDHQKDLAFTASSVTVEPHESLLGDRPLPTPSFFQRLLSRCLRQIDSADTLIDRDKSFNLPNVPPRLKVIGETLFGGIVLTGSISLACILLARGQAGASLIPGLFSIAGVIILREAYLCAKRLPESAPKTQLAASFAQDTLGINTTPEVNDPQSQENHQNKDINQNE